jgi:hypothetical protein
MKLFASRAVRAFALCLSLVGLFSCARDQQLVSISVVPDTEIFGASNIPLSADAGLSVQLRALGRYIHPPVTKDITNQVAWVSNDVQMVTVSSTGLITATGLVCGNTVVSATLNTNRSAGNQSSAGAIVTGSMTANVVCFTGSTSGSTALVGVNITAGAGTVVSSPTGILCPSTCNAAFATPSTVTLTATPGTGFTTTNWINGCDAIPSPNTCTINLTTDRIVTVTFS